MTCFKPLQAFQECTANSSGTRSIHFKNDYSKPMNAIQLACGQCIGCRIKNQTDYTLRMRCEERYHERSLFLTLTYDDLNLPYRSQLLRKDAQLFLKRLRYYYPDNKIRFVCAGEYGDQTLRPHFHLIVFGLNPKDLTQVKTGDNYTLYQSDLVEKAWPQGQVHIGSVTTASCRYVAKYQVKKLTGDMGAKYYQRCDLDTGEFYQANPEFVQTSTRPGLGYQFIEDFPDDILNTDSLVFDGREYAVPKYFDRKLAETFPDRVLAAKEGRKLFAKEHREDSTPERLQQRHDFKMSLARKQKLDRGDKL